MTRNPRAKARARELAEATGVTYSAARRTARGGSGSPPIDKQASPMVEIARGWVAHDLHDVDLKGTGAPVAGLDPAEIRTYELLEWSVDGITVDVLDGDTRLLTLTFQVEVVIEGSAAGPDADAIVVGGHGRIESTDSNGESVIVMYPLTANVELAIREDGEELEVLEQQGIVWGR